MKKLLITAIILIAAILRLWRLESIPPSLSWDEASLGYNAYSILKTLHDEYGKFLPFLNFAAFGDYKPPVYIYATVLPIWIFGLGEFAVRFTSAFFGILTVLLTYFLARRLFENETIALLASFSLAISPWHLQFSRGAFEANLGFFFSTLGIYLFVKFAKDNSLWILPSILSFVLGMYTFTGQRLFVPFVLLVLGIQFQKVLSKNLKIVLVGFLVGAIIFWPLFKFATGTLEGRLRFEEVNIFRDLEPADTSTRYREQDNFSWWSQVIHNRRFEYANRYLIHYFDAFNPAFLFTKGDVNPRLSIKEVGELYLVDFFLIIAGVYFLFAKKQKYRFLILGWLLISPLGPATARETPHALRMIHILPTFQLITAFGLYHFYKLKGGRRFFVGLISILLAVNFFYYLEIYYYHWPLIYSGDWQYGYKQAVEIAKDNYDRFDHIVVTKNLGRPYIYFLFYLKYDPVLYWKSARIVKDQFLFIDVDGFDKFIFSKNPSEEIFSGKTLYIVVPGQLPVGVSKLETILKLDKSPVFEVGEVTR